MKTDSLLRDLSQLKLFMATTLCDKDAAKAYVDILIKHKALYHFDDDVNDIIWNGNKPSQEALELMNELTNDLYHCDIFAHAVKYLESV